MTLSVGLQGLASWRVDAFSPPALVGGLDVPGKQEGTRVSVEGTPCLPPELQPALPSSPGRPFPARTLPEPEGAESLSTSSPTQRHLTPPTLLRSARSVRGGVRPRTGLQLGSQTWAHLGSRYTVRRLLWVWGLYLPRRQMNEGTSGQGGCPGKIPALPQAGHRTCSPSLGPFPPSQQRVQGHLT